MKLQTKIPLQKQSKSLIDYNSNVLLLGSCFVENIGEKLDYFKFENLQNPFGILFHPKAIETFITNAIEEKTYSENNIFFHNEQWHCFDVHSKLSNASKGSLLSDLNENIQLTNQQINKSTHIIITLGTAWAYRNNDTKKTVANCHKIPQKQFKKELMSVDAISQSLEAIVSNIRKVNSNTRVIFTVSPVRHIKDGFVENTQSKAHLISAIHQVVNNNSVYFPSYEIMMDELRDYRFYKEDMLHPNNVAIQYIWGAFKRVWISEDSSIIMEVVDTIQKGLQHKPFNPNSEAHQKFLQNLQDKIKELQSQFPKISF